MAETPAQGGAALLAEFVQYNNWANRLVLEAVLPLPADQLDALIPGAYGSLRETLAHIVRAEASYASRLNGYRPHPEPDWDDTTLPEIALYAEHVGRDLLQAAQAYTPGQIIRQQWQEKTVSYNALALWIQIFNHGVEHRTNITTHLAQLGLTPPDVDGWSNLWAHFDTLGVPAEGE